jgi:hypothetical protein
METNNREIIITQENHNEKKEKLIINKININNNTIKSNK